MISVCGVPFKLDESLPPDALLIVPALERKPLETDSEFHRRTAGGAVMVVNVGVKK